MQVFTCNVHLTHECKADVIPASFLYIIKESGYLNKQTNKQKHLVSLSSQLI